MKKILVLILPALLLFAAASAQTKRIALLSRGGKLSSMNMKSEGNFGETPEMIKKRHLNWDSAYRADSIRLADSIHIQYNKPKAGADNKNIMQNQKNPTKAGRWLSKTQPF